MCVSDVLHETSQEIFVLLVIETLVLRSKLRLKEYTQFIKFMFVLHNL